MQVFIENKYTVIYRSIIARAKRRSNLSCYTERHHVLPRSLGGTDDSDNIVVLTAKEHFICHRLLTKMTFSDNKRKMVFAMNRMLTGHKERYVPSSRTYQFVKEEWQKQNHFNDPEWQKQNGLKKRGQEVSEETRQKMRNNWRKRRLNPNDKTMIGKKHTNETRQKISKNRKGKCVGKDNPFYGKKHTTEMKEYFKTRPQNETPPWTKIKKQCPHCGKVLDPGNYTKYHGDKCKLNV